MLFIAGLGAWIGLSMLGTSMIVEKHTPTQLAQLSDEEKIEKGMREVGIFATFAMFLGSPFVFWATSEND